MIELEVAKEYFEEYDVADNKMCLSLSTLQKLLRTGKDKLELSVNGKLSLKFLHGTLMTRLFTVPMFELPEGDLPTPKLHHTMKATFVASALRQAIGDVALIGDYATVLVDPEKIVFGYQGDVGENTAEIIFTKGSEELLLLEAQQETKATFSIKYLQDILNAAAILADTLTLEYASDMPAKLSLNISHGKIDYYLAPRIQP